jgi:hypothetical protein
MTNHELHHVGVFNDLLEEAEINLTSEKASRDTILRRLPCHEELNKLQLDR